MSADKRFDLITLGETMMRLAPPQPLRLGQSSTLELTFGGAESNVAANLARLGRSVSWWSRLPQNPLAHQLVGMLRGHGVNADDVLFCEGERLGAYFIEQGAEPRGIKVWYDREHSAASRMMPSQVSDTWLTSGRWLHLTGITAALSQSCYETVQSAMQRAQAHGLTVSFDVNYRALLWSSDRAERQLAPLCHAADVVFIARRDALELFGVAGDTLEGVAHQLQAQWGKTVIVTDGSAGMAASDGEFVYYALAHSVTLVDRIGAGDAFASGVIDRLLDKAPLDEALRFGAALSALKLTIAGDIALTTRAEVQHILDQSQHKLFR